MAVREIRNDAHTASLSVSMARAVEVRLPIEAGEPVVSPRPLLELAIFPEPRAHRAMVYAAGQMTREIESPASAHRWTLQARLPPGLYRVAVDSPDLTGETVFTVGDGASPLTLPTLELSATAQPRAMGKLAPEIDARELDSARPLKLADLRGKVVVLDFWGYWCGSCTIDLTELVKVSERFAGQPVAFVALHDASVDSRAEYDRKIKNVREKLWGGRDLPFTVLLDSPERERGATYDGVASGKTIRLYGIKGFPTTVVIDKNGVVVARITKVEQIEPLVRKLLSAD
jgi:thiol-disulfide isomerase/thioredoxin